MKKIIIGNFVILSESNNNYLQINDIANIDELWSLISKNYSHYQIDFCYHNLVPPLQMLKNIGASILDDCLEMRYEITDRDNYSSINITRVTRDNYAVFAKYHDQKNSEMYWNSQRIFEHFDDWCVFVSINNQEISGYILVSLWNEKVAEIYVVESPDVESGSHLFKVAINEAKQTNHQQVLVMVDKNSLSHICCRELKFNETGFYQSFRREPS